MSEDIIKIYVGADRSQAGAIPVLEHAIKRHTAFEVELIPMIDLPDVREPKDPRNSQRTGFSFSRFCIPKLAGYKGKAIYLDADMLVFDDIKSLWSIPFDGAKIIIQEEVKNQETDKPGAPKKRIKQCSVMLLDCEALDWDIDRIIDGLDDVSYDYEDLMYDLCILNESEIKYAVPYEWNSLEYYDENTKLIHYTDVHTQPWTSCENKNASLFFNEVRLMIEDGSLTWADIEKEIELGYFRPSLINDIKNSDSVKEQERENFMRENMEMDSKAGFVPHKEVYIAKKKRLRAVRHYEMKQAMKKFFGFSTRRK